MSGWHRSSRHERGYGAAWVRLRARILARDLYLCQLCARAGRVSEATEVDHRIPKAKGGTDDASNLDAVCRACHQAKTALDEGRSYRPKRAIGADGWPVDG